MRAVRVEVQGTVQGVGFRPYVYRLATAHGLRGDVANAGGHGVIRAAGPATHVASFLRRLPTQAPPAARIGTVSTMDLPADAVPGEEFRVRESVPGAGPREISPDLATCEACRRELFDPRDRRYRYPFLNCTDCGPRATIVDDLPYDRERTAMAAFPLCPDCAAEYRDPADRRSTPNRWPARGAARGCGGQDRGRRCPRRWRPSRTAASSRSKALGDTRSPATQGMHRPWRG